MSFSRKNKVWGVAESLLSRIAKKDDGRTHAQKMKKLFIDQLEERQMLSLTVATTENLLVNTSWQDIRGDVAVDSFRVLRNLYPGKLYPSDHFPVLVEVDF